jgi:hypothetical protein
MRKSLLVATFIVITSIVGLVNIQAQDSVTDVAIDWSPDGALIVTGDNRGTVRIWDAGSGMLVHTLRGHSQEIMVLKWSPDGTRIASGSPDGTIRVWDVLNGEELRVARFAEPVGVLRAILDLDWSADSSLIAGALETGQVIQWNLTTDEMRTIATHDDWALSVAWSPLGHVLISGGLDGRLFKWDYDTQVQREYPRDPGRSVDPITSLAWSPDGANLAVAYTNGGVTVYDSSLQDATLHLDQPMGSLTTLNWSPVSSELLIGAPPGSQLVNAKTGQVLGLLTGLHSGDTSAWSPYGGRLAVLTYAPMPPEPQSVNSVRIIVPVPSVDRLRAIADACSASADLLNAFPSSGTTAELEAFVAQLAALPDGELPAACAADLVAVAQAQLPQATPTPAFTMTPIPTNTFTPTPTPTDTPTPTLTPSHTYTLSHCSPAAYQKLRLTSMCSDNPSSYRRWRIRNSNPYDVFFTWDIYGSPTGQNGFGVAPPAVNGVASEIFVLTGTEANSRPNTLRLFVNGQQQDAKASSGARILTLRWKTAN